jgi:hypothetical protein
MCSFGKPPDSKVPAQSYPGISGSRFNPVEANKVWLECLRREKEGRYVHSYLDAHNKLGLDPEWANDVSRGDGLMPDYESLSGVYNRLGWKTLENGQVVAPDPEKLMKRRRRAQERKTSLHHQSHGALRTEKLDEPRDRQGIQALEQDLLHDTASKDRTRHTLKAAHKARNSRVPHRAMSTPAVRPKASVDPKASAKPLRAGQQEPPPQLVRGAHHMTRPTSALLHSALRRSSSVPGSNTAKRAGQRNVGRW